MWLLPLRADFFTTNRKMMKEGWMYLLFFVGSLISFSPEVLAQCDCDHIISLSASEWQFDGVEKKVKPGDKICFTGGTRTGILLKNIHGTAEAPVLITNMCNSSVVIDAPSSYGNAIEVQNSSFFRISGEGNPNVQYGIEIKGAQFGINLRSLSTNFEVDHLYIHNTGCTGIAAKTDPTCESNTWRGNFTMRNTVFHDNYVANTGCEGIYIGNSHYESGVTKTCNGSNIRILEHDVINVKVYRNKVENTANDGIQIGGTISGCEVYENVINNFGTANTQGHVNGFQAGSGTTQARVYNNKVTNGKGYCFWDSGGGGSYYNNVAVNGFLGGFSLQDAAGTFASTGFTIANNTIVNCPELGIYMYSENPKTSRFANNIIVSSIVGYQPIKYNSNTAKSYVVESNNLSVSSIGSLKFANPSANDYHLLSGSTAIDKGIDMRSYGVTTDFDGKPRPNGTAFDVGAFEFQSTTTQNPPVANAGADKTITLPTSSITLTGSGTDSDGTISSYQWTKVSGGSATLTNANTASLKLSNLVAGTYTFRLTVTDNKGAKGSDDVIVTVKASTTNKVPTVKAGSDKKVTLSSSAITFNGSASDSDGTISSYSWTKVSGGSATLSNANTSSLKVTGVASGVYVFRLTVTDNNGAKASDDVKLTVNAPPVVNAGADKSIKTTSIKLTGTASDSDGKITSYQWMKIGGKEVAFTNGNTATVTISGLQTGTYTFRLRVKDNSGAAANDDVKVVVSLSGQTTAAAVEDSPELISDIPTSEEAFRFLDKVYPAGSNYSVSIFNSQGTRVFDGLWDEKYYNEIIAEGELHIYYIFKDGNKIDAGKFVRVNQ